jgi:hypothetical protein
MKKLLFIFPVVALLAATCNGQQVYNQIPAAPSPSPASIPSPTTVPTLTVLITQQQAIAIVVKQKNIDLATQNIQATFKNGNWYVDTWPKLPQNCPSCQINGGNAEYIVDAKTGVIISTSLGQ